MMGTSKKIVGTHKTYKIDKIKLALTQSFLTNDITSMSTTRIKWKSGVKQVINKMLPSALYWGQVYIYLKQTPK